MYGDTLSVFGGCLSSLMAVRRRRLTFGRCVVAGCALLMVLCFPGPSAWGRGNWWNEEWRCAREFEVEPPSYERPGEEAVYVAFTTGGYMRPDGADIRVVAGGEVTPHRVIWVGPGDRVSLLFKFVKGQRRYEVYYGNPKCEAVKTSWSPQRGLIMETRPYRGGGVNSLDAMRATLRRAGKPYGRGLVDKVWHGINPFGPSRNIVTTYSGWLHARKAGVYDLVTSSASASFMLIDDKLAVQWPGWHRAVPVARFKRSMKLSAGTHKFAYYHVQGNADPIMVAAWRAPGMKKPEIIPPPAFLPPLRGRQVRYRLRDEQFAADFTWRNSAEGLFKGRYAVTMRFTDSSFPRTSLGTRRVWEFGDGLTSKEAQPEHTYMATGTYIVSLKVFRAGGEYECRQKVVVGRDWAAQQTLKPESPTVLAGRIGRYDFEKMAARPLLGVVLLYGELGRHGSMVRAGNILLRKLDALEEKDLVDAVTTLGQAWRDRQKAPETALSIYRRGERLLKAPANRARVAVLAGDTLFYHMEKLASAKAVYEHVCKDYGAAREYVRMALMRLGDIARRLGRLEEARHYYRKSRELRPRRPVGREAMVAALRALETEDFLRRGELEEVEKSLYLWQWQDPEEKLRGQWSLLKTKLALKEEDFGAAVTEAETLVRVNPESQYVPEILLLLAEAEMKLKAPGKARAALEKLKNDYPDSPLVKEAEQRLDALGKGGG